MEVVKGYSSADHRDQSTKNMNINGCSHTDDHIDQEEEEEDVEMIRSKVELLRLMVQERDPDSKEYDDLMLRRFLRARDLDIEKAASFFLKFVKWRRSFMPKAGFISESQIQNEMGKEKVYVQGYDKKGRPIVVAFGAKHNFKRDLDEFRRFVAYTLDKLCSRMANGGETFVGVGDLKGWGFSNCDIRGYLAALEIMQEYYPERLGKVYLVHVPYIFMKAWKIIYPFIDKNTRKKICFVEDKHLKTTLLEDIDENQLPEIYGGKLPLVPVN